VRPYRDKGNKTGTVGNTNRTQCSKYHWFAGNFIKYAADPLTQNDLPVDSHELVAMCAPRPVFKSAGSPKVEEGWVDGKGMFLGGALASPVYELLGKKGMGTIEMPAIETSLFRVILLSGSIQGAILPDRTGRSLSNLQNDISNEPLWLSVVLCGTLCKFFNSLSYTERHREVTELHRDIYLIFLYFSNCPTISASTLVPE
jgi:hypothetical protein